MAAAPAKPDSASRPPREHYNSDAEATWYQWLSLSLLLGIDGVMALWLVELIPLWAMALTLPVLYVRCALSVHELMHVRPADRVLWIQRLMMVLESPFCVGYREYRDIHLRHHRFAGTEKDPEFFQIEGGHFRAFCHAMMSSEIACAYWLKEHGLDRRLAFGIVVRATCFVAIAVNFPWAFLAYLVVMRIAIGGSNFLFHHVLHQRSGEYGSFALRPPSWIDFVSRVVLGADMRHIVFEHDAHHAWQLVKAGRLPGLLEDYPKAGFTATPAVAEGELTDVIVPQDEEIQAAEIGSRIVNSV